MKTVLNNSNPPPGLLFRIAICKSERVLAPALPIHEKVKFHNPEHHPDFGSWRWLFQSGNLHFGQLQPKSLCKNDYAN
ncbi:Maturase [Trichinella spiralis]|uniref:Maturase n=1 Tax=Trichinella spiralis TaxID=6334 RepID=A0ABR3KD65_TRISP